MNKKFEGIFTALATPFTQDGLLNEAVLRELVEYNIKIGVSGLFVCGSSAEAFLLSTEERKRIMNIVAEQASNRITLIAHVGCISTDQACNLSEYANEMGYDAVSSVAPFYHKFDFSEIKQHFLKIADASKLPMFIYNIPAFTNVTFTFNQLSELLENQSIRGIKHTSNDYYLLRQLKTAFPEKIIYNGYDETFLCGLSMGADGAIGSNFNFMAKTFIKIYDLFKNGEIEKAAALQEKATKVIDIVVEFGLAPSIKVLLKEIGFDCGVCRAPFKQLSSDQERDLVLKIREIDELTNL